MSSSFAKIDSLPVRTRLLLLFAVVIAGLGVLVAMFLFDTRGVMLIEKEAKTRNVVEVAFGVLERYSSLEKTGTLTRDEAQKQAQEMLRGMRYDKAEYFWINDMQAKIVMHTAKPELDGKDMSTLKDPKGKLLFNEFVAVVKKDGAGFVDYYWPKPGENDPVPKISYVKGFTPWGWVIGSGIYIDDVDAQFRAEALRIAVVVAVILGLLVVLSTLISRGILRQLGGEPTYAAEVTQEISAGDLTRQVSLSGGAESLLGSLKAMQERLAAIFRDIHGASARLSQASQEVAHAAGESSAASQHQAEATSAMAASVEQMTVSINEVSELSRTTAD
ncbi:MAG: methyl-accepting chemotaxis protein, partial [Rhodocyclaceae bacterium]|nr:methyl-accepting chemotaxis protein [Rhodocyclaceae bacterium]